MARIRVVLLPGSVLPGDLAYGSLVAALGPVADAVVKELEVYATPEAPPDYTLDFEVAGVLRDVDERGWDRFHLVGYSGGGLQRSRSRRTTQSGSQASLFWSRPGLVAGTSAQPSRNSGVSTIALKSYRRTSSCARSCGSG
jgi:hypothetical protein